MRISAAALPFLILAAALGPPAHASLRNRSPGNGGHHPGGCCLFFIEQIVCSFVQDYYLTSSECPQPAVIFIVKWGQEICANLHSQAVKQCMEDLDSEKKRGKLSAENKVQ